MRLSVALNLFIAVCVTTSSRAQEPKQSDPIPWKQVSNISFPEIPPAPIRLKSPLNPLEELLNPTIQLQERLEPEGLIAPRISDPEVTQPHPNSLTPETSLGPLIAPIQPKALSNPLEEWLKPTFRSRGMIETEAAMAAQSPKSIADLGELQNGYGFRRVRLGAQGTIGDSSRWVSEIELAGGTPRLMDVFIGLTALPGVRELRVGYFREPFSLEGATGVPNLTFTERSPLNDLDPARNWGVCGYWWPDSERSLFALGVFRDGTTSGGQSVGNDSVWALTTRLTGLPVYEPDDDRFRLVHLGMALSQRQPFDGVVVINPRAPIVNLLTVDDNPPSPYLPRLTIPANSQQLYNLQAATVLGPWSFQGEWFGTSVQQTNAGTVFLHGFYAFASYFLTGEHRGYDLTRGAFGQVKVLRPVIRSQDVPGGGCGAFEVATRFSFFDVNSPNLPQMQDGSPSRSLLYQFEFELNWYLNDNTRVMFNYAAPVTDMVGRNSTSVSVFTVRTAICW